MDHTESNGNYDYIKYKGSSRSTLIMDLFHQYLVKQASTHLVHFFLNSVLKNGEEPPLFSVH